MTDNESGQEAWWDVPLGTNADRLAYWLCRAAQPLGLPLTADSHAAVHLIANTLADDVTDNGTPPITVRVLPQQHMVTIRVTDGRDYRMRANRVAEGMDEVRSLASALDIRPARSRNGCTLSATIPVNRVRRTLRSRLARGRRGKP